MELAQRSLGLLDAGEHLDKALSVYRRLFTIIQDWYTPSQGVIGMTKDEILSYCEKVSAIYRGCKLDYAMLYCRLIWADTCIGYVGNI